MKIKIGGFLSQSFIDFPGEACAQIYLCICPFRCPFCHNYQIVTEVDEKCTEVEVSEVLARIEKNKWALDGVSITGGEPTAQIEGLIEIVKGVKEMGLKVKIDTNGYYPDNLKRVIDMLDFIAMDFKGPWDRYGKIVGIKLPNLTKNVKQSFEMIKNSGKEHEFRLTVVPGFSGSEQDISKMAEDLKGETLVLQQYRSEGGVMDPDFNKIKSPAIEELKKIGEVAKKKGAIIKIKAEGSPEITL